MCAKSKIKRPRKERKLPKIIDAELWALSKSLGHNSTKTTEIYAHTSVRSLKTIKQAI